MLWVTSTTVLRSSDHSAEQVVLEDPARLLVDGGEGLVHQQHLRIDRERAREPDALLHAARELSG